QHARTGQDFEALHRRQVDRVARHAVAQPAVQGLKRHAVGPEAHAALVRHAAQRLPHNQAGVGIMTAGATAKDIAWERRVVGGGVVAAQARAKAVLAAGRAVTGALVAAADAQRCDDLVAKTDRPWLVEMMNADRHASCLTAGADDERGGAVLPRLDKA